MNRKAFRWCLKNRKYDFISQLIMAEAEWHTLKSKCEITIRLHCHRSSSGSESSLSSIPVVEAVLMRGILNTMRADLLCTASILVASVLGRGSKEHKAYSSTGRTSCL